jgi:hypothetical protein
MADERRRSPEPMGDTARNLGRSARTIGRQVRFARRHGGRASRAGVVLMAIGGAVLLIAVIGALLVNL